MLILAPLIWSHAPFNGTPSPATAYLDAHPLHPPLKRPLPPTTLHHHPPCHFGPSRCHRLAHHTNCGPCAPPGCYPRWPLFLKKKLSPTNFKQLSVPLFLVVFHYHFVTKFGDNLVTTCHQNLTPKYFGGNLLLF